MEAHKGRFVPINPQKYNGDPTNIIYRSSWERRVMKWLDENPNILEWQSEEIAIPYISPVDNRRHRYFPDFLVKARMPDNSVKTIMLEVKPAAQTKEPKPPKKRTKKYITEVMTWGVNSRKWEAAREYCEDKGWEFRLITEHELGLKNK